jgi:hypothetical protein
MLPAFKRHIRKLINFWPPFLAAGIRVTRWDADWRAVDVEMRLRFWNSNFVGTHYGGSLYSMADPFYMLMLIENLGADYIVWDKSASIRFRKPGTGTVYAKFRLSPEQIADLRRQLETEPKIEATFAVEITDDAGVVIAEVQKVVHIRKWVSQRKALADGRVRDQRWCRVQRYRPSAPCSCPSHLLACRVLLTVGYVHGG